VDTSTEIPYSAPVLACPTQENVPLKSIEFFLKFRIQDPLLFVRNIGASNYDLVLSSAVQDAIRRRSRRVQTERAYDLRGSDVGDMQNYLNKQMARYGVRIVGANIPDVQLPEQYQQNLATRERVAKELAAYEKEWELTRKQRTDRLLMEIERAKKERDARLIAVRAAVNKAREDVAQMLQERETEAEKIKWDIEARGRAALKAAENEARALNRLGKSYKDNWAVLQYELAVQRLQVAEELASNAPRPILVNSEGGESSALSTLLLAQLLPNLLRDNGSHQAAPRQVTHSGAAQENGPEQLLDNLMQTAQSRVAAAARRSQT
jgi:regulator of protease activity HflC (stomatin/prohibitin superfamily)